ncbi:hypothetical protein GH769_00335 [Pseudomonas sp. CFSAN084952]|uniref:hypothetical protein n=1 Tax=Pseudomonas TaxID=286 RepID=UPI001299B9EA|nr:hypothetical protein [Pseudomonas sp. CFSAN084952]QGF91737.1 hypothetical protein GH769_00335 [Pseudomonas sp. CFSAN084952]
MSQSYFWRAAALSSLLLGSNATWAGDGHDHGEAAPAPKAAALPRFAAVSDDFELVGVLNGQHLTLYLDHAADNRPVIDGELTLELSGQQVKVSPHGVGEFEVELAEPLPDGETSVMATVTAQGQSDLLTSVLDVHGEHAEQEHAAASALVIVLRGGATILGIGFLAWVLRRRTRATGTMRGAA